MKRFLLALAALVLAPPAATAQARGTVRHVEPVSAVWVDADYGPSTPGWQVARFDRVQDAVDAVASGGHVEVRPGTYLENVVIGKPLTLSGSGRDVTVINGGFDADALRVEADGVTVEGLTLKCTNDAFLGPAGLRLSSSHNTIRDNAFETAGYGLHIPDFPAATGNLVEGNRTSSNRRGLYVQHGGNTLRGNELSGDVVGIEILTPTGAVVTGNSGSSSQWAVVLGGFSGGSLVAANQLGAGIYLEGTTGNTVTGNTLSGASSPIDLFYSSGNTVSDNALAGRILLDESDDNRVTGNDLTGGEGIVVRNSEALTLADNTLAARGISLSGLLLEEWTGHTITGNRVLGAPIVYHDGVVGPFTVTPGAAQVILAGCVLATVEDLSFGDVNAVQIGHSAAVTVQRCTVASGPEWGVAATETQDLALVENDFGTGLLLASSSGEVRGNVLRGDGTSSLATFGIAAYGPFASGNVLSANTIVGFRYGGISASQQTSLVVEDNLVRENGGDGMAFFACEGLVADNVVTGNVDGIDVVASVPGAPGLELRDNVVTGNGAVGIDAGRFDVVRGNVVSGHDVGLALTGDSLVVDNAIVGNETGIEAGSSTGSALHHNALSNGTNAHDAGSNAWSDGPTGGNWWHDYDGVDLDLDGIGDTPYAIAPSGTDALPLMGLPGDLLLWADAHALAYPAGGTIDFALHAGRAQAARPYLLLGSSTGREPGLVLPGGAVLPLVWDAFTDDVAANLNGATYAGFAGSLDAEGKAVAQFVSGAIPPQLAGATLWFAYTLQSPFDVVSFAIDVVVED